MSTLSGVNARLAPAPFDELRWLTSGGVALWLRTVRPTDKEPLRRFFNGLSALARYQRFFSAFPAIPEQLLDAFSAPDPALHLGLLVTLGERIVADGRLVRTGDGEGEIAIAVADQWQGRGVGRLLVRTLIQRARERGWHALRADYFSENRRMIAVLRDAGFVLTRDAGSAVFGRGEMRL